MRNKPFPYRLSGWLLLAGLAVALPSSAEDIQGECYSGNRQLCVGTSKSVDVTFKASFTTPPCIVTVPSEVTIPEATMDDFYTIFKGWTPEANTSGDYSAELVIKVSKCDPIIRVPTESGTRFKYLNLKFTDLGNTSREAGVFATDYPPRDDVGFVIFHSSAISTAGQNVLLDSPAWLWYGDEGSTATEAVYKFRVRMQKYTDYTDTVTLGPVSGSVSVIAEYE